MKILMTSETFYPQMGGAEVHVANLLQRLRQNGHEVKLVTNAVGEDEGDVYRIEWKKSNLIKLVSILYRESKAADILHAHYSHRLAMIVGVIGLIRQKPVIITLHGMGTLARPSAPFRSRLSDALYRFFSLKLATKIISTSEDLALIAYRYVSRNKVVVIMNGYDDEIFSAGKVTPQSEEITRPKTILTVRRLVEKNGPHDLIEAMPRILKKYPDVRYVAVGDGYLKERLMRRVEELGIVDSVTFVGMVENDKVVDYLRSADVVVFPSTAESSSIACAEAMAMGKMIVASSVGGVS